MTMARYFTEEPRDKIADTGFWFGSGMWFVSVRVLNIFGVSVLVAISNPIPSKTFEVILFPCTAVSDGRIKITLETVCY